jgi:hypothetical protein
MAIIFEKLLHIILGRGNKDSEAVMEACNTCHQPGKKI